MRLDQRTIFLVDGAGAGLSALCLGIVLPAFESFIGMPAEVLRGLALVAALLAVYSLSCFALADHQNPRWLTWISRANIAYCVLTLLLAVINYSHLTALGLAYFLGESAIIVTLVTLESKLIQGLPRARTNAL